MTDPLHPGDPAAGDAGASGPPHEAAPPRGASPALVAVLLVAVSAAAIFAAGLSLGGTRVGRDADEQAAIEAFVETYRRINDQFVGEADPERLLEGAIEGMFETLDDPYSAYLGPDEFDSTIADISGELEGVGAQMAVRDAQGQDCEAIGGTCLLRVVEVLPETPALAAGLLPEDVVVAVDGQPLDGQTIDDAVALIRGPRGSQVTLTLRRGDTELDLAITRGVIVSQDVRSAVLADGQVGYLLIEGFGSRVADGFRETLGGLLDRGVRRFVVDVRGDPGGFVDAAVAIASQFLGDGPVFWEEAADGTRRSIDVSGGGLATDPGIRLAVLVDRGTASASEILAGALQDAGRATLIGERTFGKGTVQEWTQLPGEHGGFRLSVAKWLTRDQTWIHEVGLTPDVMVPDDGQRFRPSASDDGVDAAAAALDRPLQRAITLLLEAGPGQADSGQASGAAGTPTLRPTASATPAA